MRSCPNILLFVWHGMTTTGTAGYVRTLKRTSTVLEDTPYSLRDWTGDAYCRSNLQMPKSILISWGTIFHHVFGPQTRFLVNLSMCDTITRFYNMRKLTKCEKNSRAILYLRGRLSCRLATHKWMEVILPILKIVLIDLCQNSHPKNPLYFFI